MHAKTNRALPALGLLTALLSAILPTATTAATVPPAGEIMLLTGRGTAINPADGGIRELSKGDAIFAGEVVNSSANSYINIKFADGSFILLRPKTRFQIESYVFDTVTAPAATTPAAEPAPTPAAAPAAKPSAPKPATAATSSKPAAPPPAAVASTPASASASPAPTGSRAFFKLLKGGFRAVSGLIGKIEHNDYRVTTPVATIGIRGTDYLLILCDLACDSDPVLRDSLPEGGSADGGLVVGVISGGVFVANEAGKEVLLAENQYLINLPDGTQIMLPFEPRFLKVDPIPNPLGMCE